MTHTAYPWWTSQRFSAELPGSPYLHHDVYELIADYIQGTLGEFKETGGTEAIARVETQKDLIARTDEVLARLKKIYQGSNPRLYKPYQFGITVYNKRDNWKGHQFWQGNVHFGNFMT